MLKEKEMLVEEYKERDATSVNELESHNSRIKELEEDLSQSRKVLETLQVKAYELQGKGDGEERSNEIPVLKESKNSSSPEGLVLQLEDKNRTAEGLNGELRQQTKNLQELVNRELWDKNLAIEKLQDLRDRICEMLELEIMSMSGEVTLRNEAGDICREDCGIATVSSTSCTPKDEVSCLRDQLQLRKYLCCKMEELCERLCNTPERDSDSHTLRSECARLREEIDRVNAWQKDAGDACALLTKRFEELAWFLSSLLRHL
jgi:hypothetical protein